MHDVVCGIHYSTWWLCLCALVRFSIFDFPFRENPIVGMVPIVFRNWYEENLIRFLIMIGGVGFSVYPALGPVLGWDTW